MNPLTRPLLYLVALNLAPSLWLRPYWVTAFGAALIAYRWWLDRAARPTPAWWLRLPVQVAVVTGVWAQYRSLLGDESAGALLTLLTCLKIYELRSARDHFVGYLLCLLVLMSHLLLDQSLPMTLFLIVDGVLLTSYLYMVGQGRLDLTGLQLGPSVKAALKATPLVVVTFVLFPRFTTGFGSGDEGAGKMGITDQLRPGSISSLVGSNELIFRATFPTGAPPPRASMYWRGAVLDQSDGLNWDRGKVPGRVPAPSVTGAPLVEVTLEPGVEKFVFNLDGAARPHFANEDVQRGVIRRGAGTYELGQTLRNRERYQLFDGDETGKDAADDDDPARALTVKREATPAMTEFLNQHRGTDDAATVHALLEVFRRDYGYTLNPPRARTLDDFMFKTRLGFCEHYAGALATMLRYDRIPARVVLGFQGGASSLLDRFISVRAHDAHAWVEWYDAKANRWRRLDPTSQLDPRRITDGADAYIGANRGAWGAGLGGIIDRARAAYDEVDAAWTSFLIRFDRTEQKRLMSKLGLGGARAWVLPVALLAAVGLVTLALFALERRRKRPVGAAERLYQEWLAKVRRRTGHGRVAQAGETLSDYVARVGDDEIARLTTAALPLFYGAGPHAVGDWTNARAALRAWAAARA